MITQLKLKILAFGSRIMLQRLIARANPEEVTITACSESTTADDVLQKERFDMVIVENSFEDAEGICRNITNKAGLPVAIMFQPYSTDWKSLRTWEVDGYLPEEAGSAELMARIKAFSRRKPVAVR